METVTRQIVKLFHRASQMDAEQCVSRLICEVNVDPEKPKSVRINNYSLPGNVSDNKGTTLPSKQPTERVILLSFGDNDAESSPYPEFDRAARIGRTGSNRDKCRIAYSQCGLSSEELRLEAMNSL